MAHGKCRVGMIGAGTIGTAILADLVLCEQADVIYVVDSSPGWKTGTNDHGYSMLDDVEEALSREVDLVIECAAPPVLAHIAPRILEKSMLCAFSCTALSDRDLETAIQAASQASGHSFFVPHGAILALDGLRDGRDVIEKVVVTTSKSGKSLGADEASEGLLFEGATRDVCRLFPRNVNVHAAVALAGIGFDRTMSRVIAVPGQETMEHHLEVAGSGFSWDITVSSRSLGGVTGAYTPRSAIGSVRRILASAGIAIA